MPNVKDIMKPASKMRLAGPNMAPATLAAFAVLAVFIFGAVPFSLPLPSNGDVSSASVTAIALFTIQYATG